MIYIKQKIWENFMYLLPSNKKKAREELIALKKYIDDLLEAKLP